MSGGASFRLAAVLGSQRFVGSEGGNDWQL